MAALMSLRSRRVSDTWRADSERYDIVSPAARIKTGRTAMRMLSHFWQENAGAPPSGGLRRPSVFMAEDGNMDHGSSIAFAQPPFSAVQFPDPLVSAVRPLPIY
jgi:hypothetical protein